MVIPVEGTLIVLGRPGAFKEGGERVILLVGEEGRIVAKGITEQFGSWLEELLVGEAVDGRPNELSQGGNQLWDGGCSLRIQNPGLSRS